MLSRNRRTVGSILCFRRRYEYPFARCCLRYVGVGTAERCACRGRSILPELTFDSGFSRPPPAMDRAIGRTNHATSQRSRSVCAQERPPYRTQNERRTLVLQPFGKRSTHRMQAICVCPSAYQRTNKRASVRLRCGNLAHRTTYFCNICLQRQCSCSRCCNNDTTGATPFARHWAGSVVGYGRSEGRIG